MDQLVGNAKHMSDLLAEVSTATNEQERGVAEVGQAVQQLDRDVQQNAALVEETAAAANSLKDQALVLAEQVSKFQLP
jgi:methyl-accepting chemotaxis protein